MLKQQSEGSNVCQFFPFLIQCCSFCTADGVLASSRSRVTQFTVCIFSSKLESIVLSVGSAITSYPQLLQLPFPWDCMCNHIYTFNSDMWDDKILRYSDIAPNLKGTGNRPTPKFHKFAPFLLIRLCFV